MIKTLISRVTDFFRGKPGAGTRYKSYGPSVHGIVPSDVSPAAVRTCQILQKKGFKAYIVGGAVRDLITRHKPKDFDVVTDATPEQIKACMRRAIIIGRRFRLVHVLWGKETIECATFRALHGSSVRKDAYGRIVSDNDFGEMWEDAARRDFAINALFYDPVTQSVIDYNDGMQDIQNKVVRMIGDPETRYTEDPVRMLRAVRIAAKLNYTIEPHTLEPISRLSYLLQNVPQARLFDEALKLLTCGNSIKCMRALRDAGLDRYILPSLSSALRYDFGQDFLTVAMERTDERISLGKKVSPSFLFATLLWPAVANKYREFSQSSSPMNAMTLAGQWVLAKHSEQMQIQSKIASDMLFIWQMQVRMCYRARKTTVDLPAAPKFRASFDFLSLRQTLGYVRKELVAWWNKFQAAGEEERLAMIDTAVYEKGPADEPVSFEEAGPIIHKPRKNKKNKSNKIRSQAV